MVLWSHGNCTNGLDCLLNPLVFLLSVESGERVSLSMTILLSYAIFLTLVLSSIPASSNSMCALLIVMIIIIVVSGIIVFGVIIAEIFQRRCGQNENNS